MRGAAALVLLAAATAHAAPPSVAVMPFRELAGSAAFKGQVGEAIRETVTADLKQVPGLRVIERAAIDEVIRAQDLQARRNDLDAIASVRVGTLLGASILVAGAVQRVGTRVRLTARFVKVETGEIAGSAKVDGEVGELFTLEDRVTAELLRSAGLRAPATRPRPKLRSWHAVELYGDAVVEAEPQKKQKLLQQALDEDPDFVYARRDLDALEQRMAGWSRAASARSSERERAELQRLQAARTPAERRRVAGALFDEMQGARRYHGLAALAERLAATPGDAALREAATFELFVARDRLHKLDLALQAGELYLSQFPTGAHFRDVEARMRELAETRKARESRRAEYEADLADKLREATGVERDWAPCIAARWNNQVNQRMLDGCQAYLRKRGNDPSPEAREHAVAARFFVVLALAEAGEFERARPLAQSLLDDSDEWDAELRKLMADWPTD